MIAGRPEVVLSFATGRNLNAAMEAIADFELLWPRFLITDVGTAIFQRGPSGRWVEDETWAAWVDSVWAEEAAARLAEHLPDQVRLQPGVVPLRRLALQAEGGRAVQEAAEDVRRACLRYGLRADILPSHRHYIDVLPPGVNKGTALMFLHESMGLPRPIVGCGDSANDLGLFEVADLPVLVGQGLADCDLPGDLAARVHRTPFPGPEGIQAALRRHGLMEENHHDC